MVEVLCDSGLVEVLLDLAYHYCQYGECPKENLSDYSGARPILNSENMLLLCLDFALHSVSWVSRIYSPEEEPSYHHLSDH